MTEHGLAGAIEELRSEGAIEDWVQPAPMASLLIAAANGIALHSRLLPEDSPVGELAGQMAGLLVASSRHRIS